jgi:beta-aspartyl-dipeptidase (metallo-type)
MFTIYKGGICQLAENSCAMDILTANGKICCIDKYIEPIRCSNCEIIEINNKIVWPGFIDQHVHITGGGGESGPVSRIPEISASDIFSAGVTTVVGLLGADGITRNIADLFTKARALRAEGVTTYIYTGNYTTPPATLTGKIATDLVFVDLVIGTGEIAIADYRSSYPSVTRLTDLASETMIGGLIGGKAGVLHIHVGDGKEGMTKLRRLVEECDFPIDMFIPTHVNRNKALFHQSLEYARNGGRLDLTAGEPDGVGYCVPDALEMALSNGISIEKITISSDGNGSTPGGQPGKVYNLFEDIRNCIIRKGLNADVVIKTVTSNVAEVLKIYPTKGTLKQGSDADFVILNPDDLTINKVITEGIVRFEAL